MNLPSAEILTGLSEQHLITSVDGFMLHRDAEQAFSALCQAAKADDIDIKIVSAFRSFSRQAAIWQAKITGQRPVYNQRGEIVDITSLIGKAKLDAVLLYSALPGASRHHWGTEFDLYDAAAVPASYSPKLDPNEYNEEGPFFLLRQWLTEHAASFGFFMPYAQYKGGVAAEPWHLSYQLISSHYLAHYTANTLRQCLMLHPIAEQQLVLDHLDEVVMQYALNICQPMAIQTNLHYGQKQNTPE